MIRLKFQLFDVKYVSSSTRKRSSLFFFPKDYDFIRDKSGTADVLQCSNQPSVASSRGHQYPAAFLARASGLDKHGNDSDKPLRYSHMDIAGSAGKFPEHFTARPIPALCQMFLANRVL